MKASLVVRTIIFCVALGLMTSRFAFAESPSAQDSGNANSFSTLLNNLQHSVSGGMRNIQDQLATVFMLQDRTKQAEADMRDKEQDALQKQQDAHQQEEIQMQNSKDEQEMRKEQQRDLMQNLRNK